MSKQSAPSAAEKAAKAEVKKAEKAEKDKAKKAAQAEKTKAKLAARAEKIKAKKAKEAELAQTQVYRKPRADIYTVLLTIALSALVIGSGVLWATMFDYNKEIKGGPSPTWHRPAARPAWR